MKLHIGCGRRDFGEDWIHIDGGDFPHLHSHDIVHLPFANESADLIYASHVLEYFDRKEAKLLLVDWREILKTGGTLRLAVPDFEAIARLYTASSFDLSDFLGPLYGKMKMGDKYIYHKTVYDFYSLREFLHLSGFKDIKRYSWRETEHAGFDDHSQSYLPHMNKNGGVLISLNVEATK